MAAIATLALLGVQQGLVRAQEKQVAKNTSAAAPAATASSDSQQAQFVGAQTCKACHAALYNGWEKSPHWKQTYQEGGIAKHGCEDCHGPGSAHVAGGGDITKIFTFKDASTKEINNHCMTCHAGGAQHMNAINSVHTRNDVSCIACHSPHHGKESDFLLIKSQPELCYSCHLAKKAEFDMPFHHRVN
ncbi:MAG: cytochrome c3 family protein, partial [Candidatus Acidiferrales bacterium]